MKVKVGLFAAFIFLISAYALHAYAVSGPTVSTQAATSVASTSAILNGTISSEGTASTTDFGFEYGTTTSYGTRLGFGTNYLGVFYTTATGLTASTTYHYRAYAVNSVATSTGSDQSFTTDGLSILSLATSTTATTTTVTFSTNKVASSTFQFGTTTSYGTTLLTTGTTTHTYIMTGLIPSTTYHFKITATDSSGNVATTSDYLVGTSADVTPPILSGAAISPTSSYLSVTWVTDEVSDARIVVGTTTAYNMASSSSEMSTGHQIYLLGLLPSTLYHVRYSSTDPYGNTSTSSDQTVTTSAPGIDAITIAVAVDEASSTITWITTENATTQVAYGTTAGYGTYTSVTDGPFGRGNHSVTLIGLTSCTTYHYAVIGTAGVTTSTSSDATFTTTGCPVTIHTGGGGHRSGGGGASSPASSPVSAIAPVVLFARDLSVGYTGTDVRALQQFLNTHRFPVSISGAGSLGNETLYFGPATSGALARYQASLGLLPATGYFGAQTRAAINTAIMQTPATISAPSIAHVPTAAHSFTRNLTVGMSGTDVRALQELLIHASIGPAAKALETIGISNYFGVYTQKALSEYQKAKSIMPATGYFGPITRARVSTP